MLPHQSSFVSKFINCTVTTYPIFWVENLLFSYFHYPRSPGRANKYVSKTRYIFRSIHNSPTKCPLKPFTILQIQCKQTSDSLETHRQMECQRCLQMYRVFLLFGYVFTVQLAILPSFYVRFFHRPLIFITEKKRT